MLTFAKFLAEEKNLHMEHIEDLIFNEGIDGTRKAIFFLRDLRDMLSSHTNTNAVITTKFDGAPAIFAGIDPEDRKFFIAKKGLFNKEPKMYKSIIDINADSKMSPDLKHKFIVSFNELSKLKIKSGVYQGDLMYTKQDLKTEKIDGTIYITFQPNTIVYAVPKNSEFGRKLLRTNLGVVWHTTYIGNSIQDMNASFGKDIVSKMKSISSVWMTDATYKDVSGVAVFNESETQELQELLRSIGSIFNKTPASAFNIFRDDPDLAIRTKTYNNTFIRNGSNFEESNTHFGGLIEFIKNWYQTKIDSVSTDKAKDKWKADLDEKINKLNEQRGGIVRIFDLMKLIVQAKAMIINKLNKASALNTFLRTRTGFRVTSEEGFVAIDKIGNAVKLVDRLEFSLANFSPEIIKGWER